MGYINYSSSTNYHRRYHSRSSIITDKTFFIDYPKERRTEIKEHYKNLNDDLTDLTQSLNIIMNNDMFIPEWRQRLEISSPIELNIHDDLKYHLEKDLHGSLNYIQNFIEEIRNHNDEVEEFVRGLRPFVERRFSVVNIFSDEHPNRGLYYNMYINLLDIQLTSIIESIRNGTDLDNLRNNLRFDINRNEQGFVNIASFTVGNIEETNVETINRIIHEIPFDRDIVSNLRNLHNEMRELETKSNEIRVKLGEIIDRITRDHYKTSVKCCPKRYFFF